MAQCLRTSQPCGRPEVSGFWPQIGSALATGTIWGVNQSMKDPSLSVSPCVCKSAFPMSSINKSQKNKIKSCLYVTPESLNEPYRPVIVLFSSQRKQLHLPLVSLSQRELTISRLQENRKKFFSTKTYGV